MDLYEKLQNMKIALVEDDTLLRESMVLYFRTKGCTVAGFADADAAMEAFGKGFPDIVISDHFLPGPDGLALLRRIGERHPGTLRILITGHPSPEITRQVEQAGIDEFLLKPFSIEEMEEGLRRLLKNPGGRKTEVTGAV
jgi:two-component system C4-dicarboxylate transport response regulator DctD